MQSEELEFLADSGLRSPGISRLEELDTEASPFEVTVVTEVTEVAVTTVFSLLFTLTRLGGSAGALCSAGLAVFSAEAGSHSRTLPAGLTGVDPAAATDAASTCFC